MGSGRQFTEPANKQKGIAGPLSAALRYGLAFVSIAVALGLARAFLNLHLPQTFIAFALCAVAITFWYGGTAPGILAAVLAAVARIYFFESGLSTLSRGLYYLVFLIFALLMIRATKARDELEERVAERTSELTRANADLNLEIAERTTAEEKLRESEAYLSETQRITRTGSWVWRVEGRVAMYLSEEWFRIYGFDPRQGLPSWEKRLERVHPEDRARWQSALDRAIEKKSEYEVEFRILLPDRSVKYIHTVGHPVFDGSGGLVRFVGSSTDVTERNEAEEAVRQAQSDLAHVNRVTTLGELTASWAHEVNQPLAAALTDARTCLRWLTREQPDVEEAREAASRMVKAANRAAEIVARMRVLFKKGTTARESVDVNEMIREMIVLLQGEITRHSIAMRTELASDLPDIIGDRVQLQQVLMNLMVNGIDAMKDVNGPRELAVTSESAEGEQLMVSVSDSGVGLPQQHAHQIFDAFFTTKPHGTGMGLRISRSIVESHGGRLWAAENSPRGATFYVTLPVQSVAHE
jgi:PAS domain S-box-containing protein